MRKIEKPFVIVIGHKKGGVGKTSTTCNIATELSKSNEVTVIDLDSQKQFTKFNNNRERKINIKEVNSSDELVKFLKADDGLTIIDLGGYDSELARTTLLLSDLIIVPLSDSSNDIDGLIEYRTILEELREHMFVFNVKLLVNRVHHSDKATYKALKEFTADMDGFDVFDTVIRTRKEYKTILSSGKSVSEQTKGTGAIEIAKLIKEIEELI